MPSARDRFVAAGATLVVALQAAATTPAATTLGPTQMVYDWERDHCADGVESWDWDVPDMPARMWRRKSGETTLIASSNLGSRANIGPDPDHLQHTVRPPWSWSLLPPPVAAVGRS